MDEREARRLLGVRAGASRAEVDARYRARLKVLRPDLPGHDDGSLVRGLRAARLTLQQVAGVDRRDQRRRAAAPVDPRPLRRATWLQREPPPPTVDVLL